MAAERQIITLVFIILTINYTVKALGKHNISKSNNGKSNRKLHNIIQKWEFELDDKLDYPRGDKDKLRQISKSWSEYYECATRLMRSVTAALRLPSRSVAAYEGAVARLPCGLCVSPERPMLRWLYSQGLQTPFSPLINDGRLVMADNGNLTIYKARKADAGAYRCTVGQSVGGTVLLEIVDKTQPYDVVKPPASRGLQHKPAQTFIFKGSPMITFTSWTPWSECSVCRQVGRRHRYGMCFIKARKMKKKINGKITSVPVESNLASSSKNIQKLFEDFPGGLPCRSRFLPHEVRDLPALSERRNEIMIGICKVPCETYTVFEVRSSRGSLLERANNSEDVFSLSQHVPLAPPPPVNEVIFTARGERLTLSCPSTSLRDIPVAWRVGNEKVIPQQVDKLTEGRVHLNARDCLVFTEARYEDANFYSCWQRDILVGTIKLEVWDRCPWWNHHVALLAMLLVAGAVLRAADAMLRNKRRRVGAATF